MTRPSAEEKAKDRQGGSQLLALLLAAFCMIGMVGLDPVFANSAAPRILPDLTQVLFMEDTGVALDHETLRLTWQPETLTAKVEVLYLLRNTTEAPKMLTMWFLSDGYQPGSFRIAQKGRVLPTKEMDANAFHLAQWSRGMRPDFVTPYNPGSTKGLEYYGKTGQPAAISEWTLELEPGASTEIEVAYEAVSGYLNDPDYFTRYRTVFYALSPARFFEGSAGLTLEIHGVEGWSPAANLPLIRREPGVYVYEGVIGEEDLYLTLLDESELMLGLNSRRVLFRRTWPIGLGLLIAAAAHYRKRKWRLGFGVAGSVILSLNLVKPSYGMVFMMIFLIPAAVVILLASALVVLWLRRRDRLTKI